VKNHNGRNLSNSMLLAAVVLATGLVAGCQMDRAPEDDSTATAFAAMFGEFAVSFARQLLSAWLL